MPATLPPLHYGNHPDRPAIEAGQLAAYSTVRAGLVKVKVIEPRPIRGDFYGPMSYALCRVTSRRHPVYRVGEELHLSPLHLSPR